MIDVARSFVESRLHEDNTKTSVAAPEEGFALGFDHNGDSPRVLCMETCAHFARDGFETFLLPLVRLTMTSPPIEQCGDENHANPKGQTNVPGGEGGGEGIARQASGKIAGREGRRPEERV